MTNANYHSARRLLRAISSLQDEATAGNVANSPLIELIASANGMDMQNPAVLGLAEAILELPRRVAREIAEIEDNQAKYAAPGIRELLHTLSPANLQKPWSELYRDIEDKGISALTICSLLLDARGGERELDSTELSKISEDARQLLEEVRLNESIPRDVLEFVESSLVSLLQAIDEYWLKGSAVVERAVDSAIGRAVREQQFVNKGAAPQSIKRRLGSILSRVAIVVALANNVHTLPTTVHDVVHGVIQVTHPDHAPTVSPLPGPEAPPGHRELPTGGA